MSQQRSCKNKIITLGNTKINLIFILEDYCNIQNKYKIYFRLTNMWDDRRMLRQALQYSSLVEYHKDSTLYMHHMMTGVTLEVQ